MDRLYEPLRDDGTPIENSAGLMSDFNGSTRVEEDRTYEGRHTTDRSRRLLPSNRILDPIERLPLELLSLFIITALPDGLYYSPRLIELATVSKKWQRFLFSTPVLWSELVIDERQEDFLATLSVFVGLSGTAALKLVIWRSPLDWTGLTSVLSSAAQRITSLSFEGYDGNVLHCVSFALPTLLERLGYLPHLKEVNFYAFPGVKLSWIESFGLPSTVHFNGIFRVNPSGGFLNNTALGKFFDVNIYNVFDVSGRVVPSKRSDSLTLEYLTESRQVTLFSKEATLPQLELLSERLAECTCFEQLVHRTTFSLRHLQVHVAPHQIRGLYACIRVLIRLRDLSLSVGILEYDYDDFTLSNVVVHHLRRLRVVLLPERVHMAEKSLRDLFTAFTKLFPYVEDVSLEGSTWPFFASSYLHSLRALKSLSLSSTDSKYNPPEGSITLPLLQYLEVRGPPYPDSLHMPNLLKLVLELSTVGVRPTKISNLRLQSLIIILDGTVEHLNLNSLDCPDLRNLHLTNYALRATWGGLSLSNLVSITLESYFHGFMDPSYNQLCIALLYYPERLPSVQQLHFDKCVEWDILFLILKGRNSGQIGVKRIDTVTLPFVPFVFQQRLARILAAESTELPPLISLSLETTREVMFDATVPGCFSCLKNMRPGCRARVAMTAHRNVAPAGALYPLTDDADEATPVEIRSWMSRYRKLVDIWKTSYEAFNLEFGRESRCADFPSAVV